MQEAVTLSLKPGVMVICGGGHNRRLTVVPYCSHFLLGGFWVFQSLKFSYGLGHVFMTLRTDSTFQHTWLNTIDVARVGLRRPDVALGNGGRVQRGYARAPATKGERNSICSSNFLPYMTK